MNTALSHLSDELLLNRIDTLAARERRITLAIVDHLGEVERRDLYLTLGYGSMFAYCTGRLGYSASAASRRIRTARCVRRFPPVRELLVRNRVNLSTVSIVAGILSKENHDGLLERIEGRSQDEVRAIAAEYKPRGAVRDTVTPVCVRAAATTRNARPDNPTLACDYDRSGRGAVEVAGGAAPSGEGSGQDSVEARTDERRVRRTPESGAMNEAVSHNEQAREDVRKEAAETGRQVIVRFAAAPELMQQIEAARSLLSFRLPAGASLAQVLGAVLDEFIDRNDPSRRRAKRAKRAKTRATGTARPALDGNRAGRKTGRNPQPTEVGKEGRVGKRPGNVPDPRAIPASVRDEVLVQSHGRCQYVAPSGRRCDATRHLQVDHIVPVARGGVSERRNLRVLCAHHNRLEARRLLGAGAGRWQSRRE